MILFRDAVWKFEMEYDGNCFNCINCLINVNHPDYLTKFNGILIRVEQKSKWILATGSGRKVPVQNPWWAATNVLHWKCFIQWIQLFIQLQYLLTFPFNSRADYWTSRNSIHNTGPLNIEEFIFLRKLIYETTKNKVNRFNLRGNEMEYAKILNVR